MYGDIEIKEEIILSAEARKRLPSPESFGMKSEKTSIMFLAEMQNSADVQAFSDVEKISEKSYNTKKAIFFKNKSNKSRFIFPINFAFLAKDREDPFCETFELDKQFLFENKKTFFLFGMSLAQLNEIPQGDLVFDPTTTIQPNAAAGKDARFGYFLNSDHNYGVNSVLQLHVNNYRYYGGRTIIQYDLSQIPASASIQSANLKLYYYYDQNMYVYHNSADAYIHQVSRSWVEGTGDCTYSNDGVTFGTYDGVNSWTTIGGDYYPTALDTVTFYKQDYKWMAFDVTSNVQSMVNGTTTNNGWIIKWYEDIYPFFSYSQGALFYSSDYTTDVSKRPYLEISYSVSSLADYEYDSIGRVSTVTYANGVEESYTYDTNRDWMTRKDYQQNTNNVCYFDYTYDHAGSITTQQYAYGVEDAQYMNYRYNNRHELDEFWYGSSPTPKTYTYDANGNILTFEGDTYTYGTANQLTTVGSSSLSCDSLGRTVTIVDSNGTHNLSYDIFNDMTGYGTNSYSYDSFNQRVYKNENSVDTYYLTSGPNILAEYDDSDDLLAEYIYSGGQRIAKVDPGQGHLWFQTDHLGSTRMVDGQGTDMERDYYPYGNIHTSGGNDETAYQFSGKELDNGIGLYYFGSRYYHPGIGRWLVTDPAGQGFSPYGYCGNSPVMMADPDGELAFLAPMIVGGIANAIMNGKNIHNFKDALVNFGIGAASSALAFQSGGKNGLLKFTNNLAANIAYDMIDKISGNEDTFNAWDIFGPLLLETGINQAYNLALDDSKSISVEKAVLYGNNLEKVYGLKQIDYTAAKGGTSLYQRMYKDIELGKVFKKAFADRRSVLAISAASKNLSFFGLKPFFWNQTWILPHTAVTAVSSEYLKSLKPTFKGIYLLNHVCHQAAANTVAQIWGAESMLAFQSIKSYGIFSPALTSAVYGNGMSNIPFVGLWSNAGYNGNY